MRNLSDQFRNLELFLQIPMVHFEHVSKLDFRAVRKLSSQKVIVNNK